MKRQPWCTQFRPCVFSLLLYLTCQFNSKRIKFCFKIITEQWDVFVNLLECFRQLTKHGKQQRPFSQSCPVKKQAFSCLSKCLQLCNNHHNPILEHLSFPPKLSCTPLNQSLSHLQLQTINNLLSLDCVVWIKHILFIHDQFTDIQIVFLPV